MIALVFFTSTVLVDYGRVSAAGTQPDQPIKILEIQPTTSFDITTAMESTLETYFQQKVEITKMSMPLLISKAEEINGLYDIVYIGNNTYTSDPYNNYYKGNVYSRFGPMVSNNCNVAGAIKNNREFYGGNDISDIAASKIQCFIEAGQLIIFDNGIFNQGLSATKLYKNFIGYRNNSRYEKNVKIGSTSNLLNNLKEYKVSGVNKRPLLDITKRPAEYNGNNISLNSGLVSFAMNLKNNNSTGPMTVRLYIDRNGDGVFKSQEIQQTIENIKDISNFTVNCLIPSKYTGLVPWKLEVEDSYGTKTYETGFSAFKGKELEIDVLQLLPNNSDNSATLKLSTLNNYNGQNLLYRPGEYKINITEMKINEFNNKYGQEIEKGKPLVLNGKFDMVIFGFDDGYVGDLSGKALEDMIAFADSGQAIMFTHDTVGYIQSNLTTAFKDRLGMNSFATDRSKPSGINVSTGMTRLALLNANGDSRFPDTVLTSKINESNLTKYPFILGDIRVSPTHLQYIRLNPEDSDIVTAFTYRNEYRYQHGYRTANLINPKQNEDKYHEYDGLNDYYTYFRGNLTFSGTGHSPITSIEELKMFVNTMLKASVGSNHAPSVSIIGLNDGQDIANTLDTLNFSLRASDPDIDDKYLTGKLYIDNDGDGSYEPGESVTVFEGMNNLECDREKAVSLIKNVPDSVDKFRIKAVVEDSSGAQGSTEIIINNKSTPVLNLSHNTLNCLEGDTVVSTITVNAQAATLKTNYRNLELNMDLDTGRFDEITPVGGGSFSYGKFTKTLSDVNFTPAPDFPLQTGQASFKCKTAGNYTTNAKLTYIDGNGKPQTITDPVVIDIKVGTVSVVLRDNEGKAVSGQTVTLKRYNKNISTGQYTEDNSFSPRTGYSDSTGIAGFSSMPTGFYGATIVLPEGYKPVDNTNAGSSLTEIGRSQLNYDNNEMVIEMPALYRFPTINIEGRDTMVMWTNQTLTAAVTPSDLYGEYTVKWEVVPVSEMDVLPGEAIIEPGEAVIDPDTGILSAKKIGQVLVKCRAVKLDPGGNEIIGTFKVIIQKNSVDIN